ncbi:uncharacterized protein LOC6050518 isoform X2 [Culex quinquefasciatus]|uniref:uncharacterized protein LOC6050518 isoform X2 n=1 Tax=Culex quinquefasciatus TaxID=7176 RepID=UPI0018E37297|nr:uncharacterized protein LOC6050518 isoform X2 [Culex quinquefasciatus]
MECKLISRYSPLFVLFLASLVNAQTGRKRDVNNLYQVIYYGDSQTEVGKPFAISCIISIADPVEWHKDGEPLRKHSNIRHGKDEHSYIESEMGIAGNRDKIEATISVQRALPKHQGRYQCNSLYKNYHMLYVHRNASDGSEKMMPGRRGPPESILDKLDEPVVGPLLLTSMRPPLITSIAELHHPLSTPESGPLAPLETHHHHHHVDKTDKAASHKPDSGHRAKEPLEGQQLTGKANNHIKVVDSEDPTPDSDKDNEAIVEDTREDGPSGYGGIEEAPPPPPLFEDNVAPPAIDEDDSIDEEQDSIVIESKDVSLEDSLIDKLIMNKSEINGIIRVDDSEEQPPPRQHQHQHRPPSSGGLGKQLDRIRDSSNSQNNMLIAAAVIPTTSSTSTTALVTVPQTPPTTTTTTTTTTSTTTTLMPLAPVQKQHVETHGGHHHHHHHEHQQQQQQQHSATVAPVSDILHPNYDDPSSSLKYFDIAKALTLGCNITKEGDYELSWAKDGKNVSDVESLNNRFRIIKEEKKFIISRALESDAGVYTCSVPVLNASRTINVLANVIVKFESTEIGKTNMVEGETLTLHCLAFGSAPRITWIVGNQSLSASTDHIQLQEDDKGVENARLTISAVTMADYTDYTCEGRNNATDISGKPAHVSITVRIRGKYAALYVFVGIIAEVVVLCIIILICERRRNKTEIEESDTDQSPDQRRRKSSRNYN